MKYRSGILPATLFTILFFICCTHRVSAQLVASFTADKQGGCSPLNVRFINTTTGASAAATWAWNFGNGNTSTLRDPGASYFTEQAYTVTLTVTDAGNTSTKTMTITVYKKPTVDFSVSPANGCVPLNVNFTSIATPGDGAISNYLWDFGDGGTVQGANYSTTTHSYTFPQTPPITLNVTNSYGCYSTITKSNQVTAVRGVTAAFTPSSLTLCNAGEAITFSNTSTGSGTLTYSWDFGDGSALSPAASPAHVYAASGSFVAKLTVTSSDGCSATLQSASINVANFTANFTVPAKICQNQQAAFNNTSTQSFNRTEWYVDNSPYFNGYYNYTNVTFAQPGPHTLRLVSFYGNCSAEITKTFTVDPTPVLNGFITQLQGACGAPVTVNFRDTCSTAVAWEWKSNFGSSLFGTTQNASNTFTSGSYDYVYLTVRNSAGCSATASKYIYYDKPNINIYPGAGPNQGCTGLTLSFTASPDTAIATYKWNFGDGSPVSIVANPTHVFNVAGIYTVTLNYTTNNGCVGTATYNSVTVVSKPNFDFTSSPAATVCGNNPVTFTATPPSSGWYYYWSFNDTSFYNNYGASITNQFRYDTTYTVKMIATNSGCSDTVIKNNFIRVLPPFPHIQQVLNTCDGTRGAMRFTENSDKALQWSWDFGDGATDNYSVYKDTIRHTYTATGTYNVVLSATNGTCTVRDSVKAYVLLKQHPVLSSTQTSACGSDIVSFKLSGYELNPTPYNYNYYYYVSEKQYGDFTNCNATISGNNYYWQTELLSTLQSLDPGKNDVRMITTSAGFGCKDTSNFMPLRIHGPAAGFKVLPHSGCFKDAVAFTDTSHAFNNIAIVKWEWNFGDNRTQTLTSGGSTTHLYNNPGNYYVSLKVTDADGCTNETNYYSQNIQVGGPKADFSASAYIVPVNTTVYFYDNSNYYNSYYYSSIRWIFSDSTTSTNSYPYFFYTTEGNYTVTLITTNSQTGCTDTSRKVITVRKVNSAFTYNLSYINNNACPPVIATFTSISTNAVRLSWSFGDGGIAGDQRVVSHTYNNPGIYRVVHYSFDANNAVDSTEDYIEVKGPYALLHADNLFSCNTLQVILTADVKNASNFTWDFGDGTVIPTTDTFATHNYLTPGIYVPSLILKDAGGCTATSSLPGKIIVDSLSASFNVSPAVICDSAVSVFTPQVSSLSNAALQAPLHYTWVTSELTVTDTSYNTTAGYFFTKIGTHTVRLTVASPYGCLQTMNKTVMVKEGVKASISGVINLCQGFSTSFTGTATPANAVLQWKWDFGNGNLSAVQNPPAQIFNNAGQLQISLIVNNGSCYDTAYHPLMVNTQPVVSITPVTPFVCLGGSTSLTASGGLAYQWSSNGALSNAGYAVATASPATGTLYFVKVTDMKGCSSNDSVYVKVVAPVQVSVPPSLFACEGSKVQLNAGGADKYKWINNTTGISDINIANPSAVPGSSVTYTVVGYDNYNCFTDTASLPVRISRLPLVEAGTNQELIAGSTITLAPTIAGAVNWAWSPADYLSCTSCLNPVSKPTSSTTYILTAFNADGCANTDRVTLRLLCKDNLVFIPNAFSPNDDSKNDRFNITGSGVKSIRSIIIYSRWGKVIFERKNININDRNNSWDGTYNGEPMPAGAYVYWINTECEGGDIFNYRGTVIIMR